MDTMETAHDAVTKQIEEALLNDARTAKSVIDVGFRNGIVTLTGSVRNASISQAAEEIARSNPGVLQVVNELHIG